MQDKPKVLVVDDEKQIRKQLMWALNKDFELFLAENGQIASEILGRENPDIVILDLDLAPQSVEEKNGLDILQAVIQFDPNIKVIMVTGDENKENALKAIKIGAYDYYSKPINIEELKIIIKRALHIQELERENEYLQERLEKEHKFTDILGSCPQMEEIFSQIRKVSTTEAAVLILGDSGTGKELVAQAIHYHSLRKGKPFVIINCGAIPENLLESEFFGHEKGAFTGAHIQRKGKFELADEGTIFLDEIGELPLSLQVKLLRFLQEKKIERIGGRELIDVDVRIIAATNKDLKVATDKGDFREDLYYRLSVISISLPLLKDRGNDIFLLANHFLNKFNQENNKNIVDFNDEAVSVMRKYSWPGNARELENRIKRAVIMTKELYISPEDLDLNVDKDITNLSLKEARMELEKRYIKEALRRTNGNISGAAKELEISRTAMHDLMRKYGVGE